jgi:hypothetical protein
MAEVKRVPEWIMLEALRNNVLNLYLEKSDGTSTGLIQLEALDFEIDTAVTEPVLKLKSTETLQVGAGDTIMAIVLYIEDTDAPEIYGSNEHDIRFPIVDVDGNGETFPDGGSIDVTEFEVYLNDL